MAQAKSPAQAPAFIRYSGPITRRLLGFGVPMGPNSVVTMRGRLSGRLHSVPLAVFGFRDRRFLIGTFGETNWVRNLRAAGVAEIQVAGRPPEHVRAVELRKPEAEKFFHTTLVTYLGQLPLLWRLMSRIFIRVAAPELIADPQLAAARHPVFELKPMAAAS
jgi:hypothetical protein